MTVTSLRGSKSTNWTTSLAQAVNVDCNNYFDICHELWPLIHILARWPIRGKRSCSWNTSMVALCLLSTTFSISNQKHILNYTKLRYLAIGRLYKSKFKPSPIVNTDINEFEEWKERIHSGVLNSIAP